MVTRESWDSFVAECEALDIPRPTERDILVPSLPRRVDAIIGMRRVGKTCFLARCSLPPEKLADGGEVFGGGFFGD